MLRGCLCWLNSELIDLKAWHWPQKLAGLGASIKLLNSYQCWHECVTKTQAKLVLRRKPDCWSWSEAKSLPHTLDQSLKGSRFYHAASSFSNSWDPKLDAKEMHLSISVHAWMHECCFAFGFRGQDQGTRARAQDREQGGNLLHNQYLSETGVIGALCCDLLRYQRLITMPLSQFILFIFMSLQGIRHSACCSWGKGCVSPRKMLLSSFWPPKPLAGVRGLGAKLEYVHTGWSLWCWRNVSLSASQRHEF